ncbi:MAG: DNA polymerase III subunit gamma/tau [Tissierellia bacterium]|nr:DNA polymerase III subunit gamma/tau [Tissierellia bacterium]
MYQALYRKYRPIDFENLLSHEHITQTLKNQIISGDISHAYLFSGTRGTGKTSAAKIFSRAVNCLNPKDGNPCNECSNCLAILNESAMDVVEMDAASNNSVDDIRDLKDRVIYPPTVLKYKVYIIDEVHMLSKGAFNALLKILEEPPKHLIFILATTEPQRIPQTILSRCQRFYFKRVQSKDIISNLKHISDEENLKVDDKVYQLIAQNSDGAMRDALSLFDQLISYQYDEITYDMAINMLGIANADMIFDLVGEISEKSVKDAIMKLDDIIQKGKDIEQLIIDLTEHFRNLMIAKSINNNNDDIIEFDYERYREQSKEFELNTILDIIELLNDAQTTAKYSTQPRVIIEMTIVNACQLGNRGDLEERIKVLEDQIQSIVKSGVKAPVANSIDRTAKQTVTSPSPSVTDNTVVHKKVVEKKVEKTVEKEDSIEYDDEILEFGIEKIEEDWPDILESIKAQPKKSLHALIIESILVAFKDNTLTIGYNENYGFHKTAISTPENTVIVESVLSQFYNSKISLRVITIDESASSLDEDIKGIQNLFGSDNVEIF